jgi:hypothetical protein
MEIIRDCQQYDERYWDLRLGSVGGSDISPILAKGKGRQTLKYRLAKEIITGKREQTFVSKDMQDGHLWEPKNRAIYEWRYNVDVEQVAMIRSSLPGVHVSPDGLVGENGGLECKHKKGTVFLEFLAGGCKIEKSHLDQCQHFLGVSGREWIDYSVYASEFDETNEGVVLTRDIDPLWVKRIYRDEEKIKEIQVEVVKFVAELNELLKKLC